jgi:hypothetical protein
MTWCQGDFFGMTSLRGKGGVGGEVRTQFLVANYFCSYKVFSFTTILLKIYLALIQVGVERGNLSRFQLIFCINNTKSMYSR